ncbi:MAG: DUF3971 domain-containing protein, partial [Pseudomonadota bacterium]
RITAVNASVTYIDALSDRVWTAQDAEIAVSRPEGGGVRLAVQAALDLDRSGEPTLVSVTGARAPGAAEAEVALRFQHAPTSALAAQFPDLDAFRALEGYISGDAQAAFELDSGDLTRFSAAIRGEGAQFAALRRRAPAPAAASSAGAGSEAPRSITGLSAFQANFDYAPDEDAVTLRRLEVVGDRLRAVVRGEARFLRSSAGAAVGASGALAIERMDVVDPALFADPLRITEGEVAFRLEGGEPGTDTPPRLDIETLRLVTADVTASGSAALVLAPPPPGAGAIGAALGARADLDLTLTPFQATRLAALWPRPAAPGARLWVERNIIGGRLLNGRLKARIGGGAGSLETGAAAAPSAEQTLAETVDFRFDFEALATRYLREMTPITEGRGDARVFADRFELSLAEGTVDLSEGGHGEIRLDGSEVVIPTFKGKPPPAEITVRSEGSVRALLALLDQEPLALPRKLSVTPAAAEGQIRGETKLAFPLSKTLRAVEVAIDAEGTLAELSLPVAQLDGRRASARAARIEVTGERLRLRGATRLEGVDGLLFDIDWTEMFRRQVGVPSTRLRATTTIDAARLREAGAPPALDLTGDLRATVRLDAGGVARSGEGALTPSVDVSADLGGLGAAIPWLGWRKAPGEPGRVAARGTLGAEAWSFTALTLESEGLFANGAADLAPAGRVRTLTLDPLRTAAGSDLALSLNFSSEGGVTVTGGGPRFHIDLASPEPVANGAAATASEAAPPAPRA